MSNLLNRTATGFILFVLTTALVLFAPFWLFFIVAQLVVLLVLFEYSNITLLSRGYISTIIASGCYLSLGIYAWIFLGALSVYTLFGFFAAATLWWVLNIVIIVCYPRANALVNHSLCKPINALLLTLPFLAGVLYLKEYSPLWLLLLLVIVVSVDVCSYVFGKIYGTHAPLKVLSPNKTIEGFIGGALGAIVISCTYVYFVLEDSILANLIVIVATILFALLGDVYQSMYKRIRGVKDSGNILPGHGGIWDRIDSLLAATPVFMLMLTLQHII